MCGIAGFFSNEAIPSQTRQRMLAALRQRGPDAQHITGWDHGWRRSEHIVCNALLHARLSIIDPRPVSDQPMSNAAGDIWICYNGEVYDWAGHADELRALGYEFKTRSDTEFILHAYEAWGMDMLPRLRGMFAIVILDLRQRKLWMIRDRMGLKPLVYSQRGEQFAFGSTVRSVLPFLQPDARGFDADAIDAYLAHRYIPAPMTVFSGIRRLENAHWLCFDLQSRQLTKTCYWQPEQEDQPASWTGLLDEAVHLRTVADRPLGLFLSSGIDSSLVASRLAATGHTGLQTFTAGFSDPGMDESSAAAEIAVKLGFPNQVVPIPARIQDDIERIVADLDEPFADPSCVPTWYLARETTKQVKVVLGGDGGDEMFAGYKRFDKHLRSGWRASIRLGGIPVAHPSGIDGKGWRRVADEARMSWHEAYSLRFSGFTPTQRACLQPDRVLNRAVYWRMPPVDVKRTPLKQLLEIDRLNYLPEYILRKGDLTTMAHGLELRAPLLDHRWVGYVSRLPDAQRFTHPAKQFVAPAMPQLVAMDLFHRKKKGFNPPLAVWLREDLANQQRGLGAQLAALSDGQIDAAAVETLLNGYRAGQEFLAEQVLQLLLLAMSLRQLRELAQQP
jgi:asparagine synthase (glutamine-hydrolysing)